ncbi:MAG: pectate lyase [Prevotella sp.]|nr:pectate lyase [Prevotella sp.]
MKTILPLFLCALTASATAQSPAKTPAFPGAEGHGRYVTGGRGGKVIHVTNLNDSGAGSLRAAVKGNEKKIVVFDVAGVIPLESTLNIGANTTIAGQTAPYPGITLRYNTLRCDDNIIMRFIRSRRGQEKDINDGADAIYDNGKTGIILDHCSFSWSIDEVASFYDNNNFTMQWCTIAESLSNPGHSKGAHGYGGIWGGKLASFHHNLIAHVTNRGPRFNGARYGWTGYTDNYDYATYRWENPVQAENVDFRNCVMYNCQGSCYGGPGGGQINIVNNYFKAGPRDKSNQERITLITVSTTGNSRKKHPEYYGMTSRYYIAGNTTETVTGTTKKNRDWDGVKYDKGVFTIDGEIFSKDPNNFYGTNVAHVNNADGEPCVRIKMDNPAPAGYVTTHTAEKAFDKVLAFCGAALYRDDVDARYMTEARDGKATYKGSITGKWGLIDVVADVNGYTEKTFPTGKRPDNFDTDGDGMSDAWEKANGLNPADASDANKTTLDPKGGYTNIEVYCNSIIQDIMTGGNTDAISTPKEYYPQYHKEDGSVVEAIGSAI